MPPPMPPPPRQRVPEAALAPWTTFRIGGGCRELVHCASPREVTEAVRACAASPDVPWELIGWASNLLVADAGFPGTILRYVQDDLPLEILEDGRIRVEAGAGLDALAAWTAETGREGLICCTGIPGTVGGAIAGNAGAFGEQIATPLFRVELLDRQGRARWTAPEELGFRYRDSGLKRSGDIVLRAEFALPPGDRGALLARREEILALRRSKHPDLAAEPTIGSFFKNLEPTSAAGPRQAAGWFLDQAGARGMREGRARVFERHANIIVADAGATAADVLALSRRMAAAVQACFGIELEREIRFLGRCEGLPGEPEGFH